MGQSENGNGWARLIVSALLASLPSALVLSGILAVAIDRGNRNTADIRTLQEKGSDPVQTLSTQVALKGQELETLKESFKKFEANQQAIMNSQTLLMQKLDQHLAQTKPISMVTP